METSQNNNTNTRITGKNSPEKHEDTETHLEFTGGGKENSEASDAVNQPEHHISKEEFDQRESGQANSSKIPPPDDAPRGL